MDCSEPQQMQKNLELHLTGTQVEEALAEDKQTVLIQYLDSCTAGLEALVQYGQSLHVSQLAVCRVLNVSHRLVLPQTYPTNSNSDSTHLTMQLQQVYQYFSYYYISSKIFETNNYLFFTCLESQKQNKLIILKDLIEHCSTNIVLPKHLYELINVNYIKKRDFCIAAKNFRKFLNNFKLSIPQMKKLNQQYNNILNDYQQTRHTLDLELPKAINMYGANSNIFLYFILIL
ncbi:uncharacterized protein LOC128875196 [Hylaeus volcanicus]|uniref:uncharacterized protein LOC128875196 n=1 Tax=Hylaeus volcanicus TaxID=313075 RepID=UPI0023B845D3|nr:uncharacterized protein LOC128875196 [Hylaeus volcanicus]